MRNAELQKKLAKLPPDAEVLINIFDAGIIQTKKGLRVGGAKSWRGNNFSDVTCVAKASKPIGGIDFGPDAKEPIAKWLGKANGKIRPVVVIGRSTAFSL